MTNLTLPHFIRRNLEPITEEWRDFAETLAIPGTTDLVLRDHIHHILFYIADDIESIQSSKQQFNKSQGKRDHLKTSPGALHGEDRRNIGFNMIEMVAEYRALRATITKQWTAARIVLTDADIVDLIRFNESIDQLLAQSIAAFVRETELKSEVA